MHDHTTACHQLSPTRGSLISKPKIPTFVVAPWESDVMMTAEPDYRWDGDRWWRWASGRWGPVSPADPQPRLAEVRTVPNRSDAELVASWMRFRGGTKKALRSLPSLLTSDEAVEFILAVELGDNQGILVLTSARLFFATNVRSPRSSSTRRAKTCSARRWRQADSDTPSPSTCANRSHVSAALTLPRPRRWWDC